MLRQLKFAFAAAVGVSGCAQLHDAGPRLVSGGENAQVVYAEPSRNVVGGGVATVAGGGDNLQIAYGPNVTTEADTGLAARLENVNGELQVVYGPAAPSSSMVAGRTNRPRG